MSINYTPELEPYKAAGSFRFWCQKVLPLVYDDSLSYYELLCKVVKYLNDVIQNVDGLHSDIEKLLEAYKLLQEYVNNYFDNLDVQEEINNKLDELVDEGYFKSIITALIGSVDAPDFINIASTYGANYKTNKPLLEQEYNFSAAQHNAFPNIIYFNNKFYLFYRKGTAHASYDGDVYVMSGDTIDTLSNETMIAHVDGRDLRGPYCIALSNTILLMIPSRGSGQGTWSYVMTYDGNTPSSLAQINANVENMYIGGQPIIVGSYIYCPYYVGSNENYGIIRSGDNGQTWVNIKTLDGGNESALMYNSHEQKYYWFINIQDRTKGSFLITTNSLEDGDLNIVNYPMELDGCTCCDIAISSSYCVPLLSYRSANSEQNLGGASGEINLIPFYSGKNVATKYNIFNGNNVDIGYGNLIKIGTNVYYAFYLYGSKIVVQQYNLYQLQGTEYASVIYRKNYTGQCEAHGVITITEEYDKPFLTPPNLSWWFTTYFPDNWNIFIAENLVNKYTIVAQNLTNEQLNYSINVDITQGYYYPFFNPSYYPLSPTD